MTMADKTFADYACDRCRARKSACSRGQPSCKRCSEEQLLCLYSRHGVIRRSRRSKNDHKSRGPPSIAARSPRTQYHPSQSHLSADIEHTRGKLDIDDASQSVLERLEELSASTWLATSDGVHSDADMNKQKFVLFADQMSDWTDLFEITLDKGRPMFFSPPVEVLDYLRSGRPQLVKQRAWLVAFYSVILSHITSINPDDIDTKNKVTSNLWLAFNSARLLLEPSEASIQALVILAVHVEEFTSPALSWTLITNACRMLQALGLNQRRLEPCTFDRRTMLFWYMNMLDKGLAIVFKRPPTFHRAMVKEVPMPPLEQLITFRPHLSVADHNVPGLFGAHYLHHLIQLSPLMGDIWTCLYEDSEVRLEAVDAILQHLEVWYEDTTKILQAAAMTERPFLSTTGAESIDIGLVMPTFQYNYLILLLAQQSPHLNLRAMEAAKSLLATLVALVSDSQEVFNGIVWQLICCPFTAFLYLFNEIFNTQHTCTEELQAMLGSMQQLPSFLVEMAKKNSLAAKLLPVADALMKFVRVRAEQQELQMASKKPAVHVQPVPGLQRGLSGQLQLPAFPQLDGNDWHPLFATAQPLFTHFGDATSSSSFEDFNHHLTNLDTSIDWFNW